MEDLSISNANDLLEHARHRRDQNEHGDISALSAEKVEQVPRRGQRFARQLDRGEFREFNEQFSAPNRIHGERERSERPLTPHQRQSNVHRLRNRARLLSRSQAVSRGTICSSARRLQERMVY